MLFICVNCKLNIFFILLHIFYVLSSIHWSIVFMPDLTNCFCLYAALFDNERSFVLCCLCENAEFELCCIHVCRFTVVAVVDGCPYTRVRAGCKRDCRSGAAYLAWKAIIHSQQEQASACRTSTVPVCLSTAVSTVNLINSLPYLTLPSGWAGCYTCPALRPYQFGPMRNPDVTRRSQLKHRLWGRNRLWSWTNHQPPGTGDV